MKTGNYRHWRLLQRGCCLLIVLALASCATQNQSANKSTETGEVGGASVEDLKTPDGHSFRFMSMPQADRTAVAISWSTDLPDEAGVHEVTARLGVDLMLNGGAGGRSAEEIIADFEDLDSGSLLRVQPQAISGFVLSPLVHMETASNIANLVLTQPNFEERWFEREKKKYLDSATARETIVEGLAWNLSRELILGDHPYKNFWSLSPVSGIEGIKLADVKAWHSKAFDQTNATIAAAGNASAESVAVHIDRVMADLPVGSPSKLRDFSGPQTKGRTVLYHQPDAPKSVMLLYGELIDHDPVNDLNIQLGIGVLGYGKQSRLFKAVRSGLRASYGFSADTFDMTRNHRTFFMTGEVETAKLQAALDEVKTTYMKFRDKGVGPLEFPIARKFYVQNLEGEFKKPESVAYLLMDSVLSETERKFVASLPLRVGALDRAKVNQSIKEGFPPYSSLTKIIVSPDADAIEGACVITSLEEAASCP